MLVLSLFPGADLLGRAFEAEGFCVVRGPDVLWGADVRAYQVPAGVFDGIIGGPPCQQFSTASAFNGTSAENLIPEFLRIVDQAKPRWAVMENVVQAPGPDWPRVTLRDWDCGGNTHRKRGFWFLGVEPPEPPPVREGEPAYSVCASHWKIRTGIKNGGTRGMHQALTPQEAARLQGFDGLADRLIAAAPAGVTPGSARCLAIHMLGNGVPMAMGRYVARAVRRSLDGVGA